MTRHDLAGHQRRETSAVSWFLVDNQPFLCWQWTLFGIIIFTPNMMVIMVMIKMIRNLNASEEYLLICLKKVWIYIKSSQEQMIDHMWWPYVKTKRDKVDLGLIIMRITARETGVTWHRHLTRAEQSGRRAQIKTGAAFYERNYSVT